MLARESIRDIHVQDRQALGRALGKIASHPQAAYVRVGSGESRTAARHTMSWNRTLPLPSGIDLR